MRSVPVKLDAKMSRRAAITTGNISKERGTSHAYIVFQQEESAVAALTSNMHVVCMACKDCSNMSRIRTASIWADGQFTFVAPCYSDTRME